MELAAFHDRILKGLGLDHPPVALAFVESAPPAVAVYDQEVPSACTLWRRAEAETFFAPAERHFNCPVGAMTMGFELPEAVQQQLMGVVEKMCGCGYLSPTEPGRMPSVQKAKTGIVYGPLKDFPLAPDLILLWLTPRQAMLLNETTGHSRWTEDPPAAVFGRPACAALPIAYHGDRPAVSLGCMGMRTFTEIHADLLLAVIPGSKVKEFAENLEAILGANETMRQFYEEHKASFAVAGA